MALLRPYSVIMTDFKSNPHVKCSPFNPSEQVGSGSYSGVVLCTLYELCTLHNLAQTRAFKWKPFSQKEATEEPCYRSWQWFLNVVFRRLYQWETAVLALTLFLVAIHCHSHTDDHPPAFFIMELSKSCTPSNKND